MAIQAPRRKTAAKQRGARSSLGTTGRDWIALALLAVITFAVFAPVCGATFVYWDDNLNVSKNASLNPPTVESVAHFWWDPYLDLYIPLTYTAWGLLAMAAQLPQPDTNGLLLNPAVFHVANLLVHVASVMIVYRILRRLIGPRWPAAAGALLFAVHPLQVEPVAWITGMKDLLSGLLALIAIHQYICFAQTPKDSLHDAKRIRYYVLSATAFVLALLSKPSAMVAPFLMLVIELGVIRRSLRQREIRAAVKPLSPMLILSVGWVVVSTFVQSVAKPADGGHVLLRPLIAADALAFYLYKLFVPVSFCMNYDHAPMTVIRSGWLYFTWIAPAALLAISVGFYRKVPWLLPSALLFVVGVAPVLGLTPFSFQRFSTVADRYVYLSMLGPALALAAILARWRGTAPRDGDHPAASATPPAARSIIVVLFVLLGMRSFVQTFVWKDTKRLFTHALKINPRSYDAYAGLAADSEQHKEPYEAIKYANLAIATDPDRPDAYVTLGTIDTSLGQAAKAEPLLEKAVALSPDNVQALMMLGSLRGLQGRNVEAETLLRKAIKINPLAEQAHLNLTVLLASVNRFQEAMEQAELAVRLDAGDPLAQTYLAMLLAQRHDREAALEHLRIALHIDPTLPQAIGAYDQLTRPRRPKMPSP
ncbi:MAG TPA: tetratricopeptide repeat protein [Tepidisphaeraceae bacterium]|jgi:Tfp pilus assembly protein PilF|nr:tetratricopeptide repeat protein [Tepidisphaeraceae bacterium]